MHINSRYAYAKERSKERVIFDGLDEVQAYLSLNKVANPASHARESLFLFQYVQLSYAQWLEWELHVDPHNDFMLQHDRFAFFLLSFSLCTLL